MSMRTAWRPEAKEPPVIKTPKEVLDNPPRRWPVPLMVLVAVLLGMGSGAWIAGNNERALDATAERLVEVSEDLESARAELSTAREDLATATSAVARLQGAERMRANARLEQAAALEDSGDSAAASAELFDTLPAGSTAGLGPTARARSVLERNLDTSEQCDRDAGYGAVFTPDARVTLIAADLRKELRDDQITSYLMSPCPQLRYVGEPAQVGSFVWTRYHEAASDGVMVVRLRGGKILHLWIVVRTW